MLSDPFKQAINQSVLESSMPYSMHMHNQYKLWVKLEENDKNMRNPVDQSGGT